MIAAPLRGRGSQIEDDELDDLILKRANQAYAQDTLSVCLGLFRSSRASNHFGDSPPPMPCPAWRLDTRISPLDLQLPYESPLSHKYSDRHTVHGHVTIRD